jgi:hypothetical protein
MSNIVISYRRSDSIAITGRICDRLVAHYGRQGVFMDIDGIPYGTDFRERIDGVLRECKILIVVVGTQWLGTNKAGEARILEETDPVRIEVQTGLANRLHLIPVLVNDAKMPDASELPESIKEFAYRNALKVDSGPDFHPHVDRLIGAMDEILGIKKVQPSVDGASQDAGGSGAAGNTGRSAFSLSGLFWYLAVPALLLCIFHYLIVFKFDLDIGYLRAITIGIPFVAGFLLFWQERQSLAAAFLLGAGIAVLSVLGMLTATGLIEETAIIPVSVNEWQRTIEFAAGISLAMPVGNQLARTLRSVLRKRAGQQQSRRIAIPADPDRETSST